jgi:deaminated glutathione amidase
MSRRFLAAAIQFCATSDKEANFANAARLAREAATRGAALIVLPELFFWRGAREEEQAAAEPIPGPTTERLAALARDLRVHLVGGSLLEAVPGAAKAYNTCVVFDPRGALLATYRKIHLFDVDIPGHVAACESATRLHGVEPVTVQTELANLGLSVCYDLRFPELYGRLSRAGAEIVCVPSAFTFHTGAHHWEILLRARAIENQVYVVAPNQIGRSASGIMDFGHSLIIDPWGTPIARASNQDGVAMAEIDLDYLARVRRELPCLAHRTLSV